MLTVENTSVTVRGKHLLNRITAIFRASELTAIVGANGAGKSTLLKLLSNDLHPNEGGVYLDGKPLSKYCPLDLARRRAVMPQSSPLTFAFRVEEVVLMGRYPFETSETSEAGMEIARCAMKEMDVERLRSRSYTTLSGGEKQRVHLARVLTQIGNTTPHATSRHLLLDEPTASLDLHHQHHVLNVVKSIASNGVGVTIVMHDLNLAATYADRIVVLKAGCKIADGTPEEVIRPEIINEAFGYPVHIARHPTIDRPLVVPCAGPHIPTQHPDTKLHP